MKVGTVERLAFPHFSFGMSVFALRESHHFHGPHRSDTDAVASSAMIVTVDGFDLVEGV